MAVPGGKPDTDESMVQTAIRETREETGLDISELSDALTFFGYYVVEESEDGQPKNNYTQVRYYIHLPRTASEYILHTSLEDTHQAQADAINFAEFVSFEELEARVGWLAASEEYQALKESIL